MTKLLAETIRAFEQEVLALETFSKQLDFLNVSYESNQLRQQQEQTKKALQKDYAKTRIVYQALEAITQTIVQGKSTKSNAPDGNQDIGILEKMAAYILGLVGLSNTGLSTEQLDVFTNEERVDLLVKKLNTYQKSIKNALESIEEDIDQELFSCPDEDFADFIKDNDVITIIEIEEEPIIDEQQQGSTQES